MSQQSGAEGAAPDHQRHERFSPHRGEEGMMYRFSTGSASGRYVRRRLTRIRPWLQSVAPPGRKTGLARRVRRDRMLPPSNPLGMIGVPTRS